MRTRVVLSCFHRHADEFRGAVGEFGDKFRRARESKELSFDDVSNVTKISARMLQAIEEEHFDQLPGGVFNRGFIRAYAKHLGLNSDEAVNNYLACLHQAQIDAHEVWQPERPAPTRSAPTAPAPAAVVTPDKPAVRPPAQVAELPDLHLPRAEDVRPTRKDFNDAPSISVPWKGIVAVACVLIVAFFLWTRHSRGTHAATENLTSSIKTPSSAPVPQPSSPAPIPQSPATASAARPSTSNSAAQAPKPSEAASPATAARDVQEKVVEKSDVTIRSFGPPTTAPSIKPVASLSLVIRATETSWISITSDGQLVTQETLIAPANTTIHAAREIVARVGNAAGVTFLWNGQEIPAQGAEAEAKTFIFDSQGMRELPSQSTPQN